MRDLLHSHWLSLQWWCWRMLGSSNNVATGQECDWRLVTSWCNFSNFASSGRSICRKLLLSSGLVTCFIGDQQSRCNIQEPIAPLQYELAVDGYSHHWPYRLGDVVNLYNSVAFLSFRVIFKKACTRSTWYFALERRAPHDDKKTRWPISYILYIWIWDHRFDDPNVSSSQ